MISFGEADDSSGRLGHTASSQTEKLQATLLISHIKPAAESVNRSGGEELICSSNEAAVSSSGVQDGETVGERATALAFD